LIEKLKTIEKDAKEAIRIKTKVEEKTKK